MATDALEAMLLQTLPTLDALYRRHRNQHHSTAWWRHLSTLRRSARRLLVDCRLNRTQSVKQRAKHVRAWVVPSCFRAFSQLSADRQFAPLGLVLLSLLARLNTVLAAADSKEPGREADAKGVVERSSGEEEADEGQVVLRGSTDLSKMPPKETAADRQEHAKGKSTIDDIFAGLV